MYVNSLAVFILSILSSCKSGFRRPTQGTFTHAYRAIFIFKLTYTKLWTILGAIHILKKHPSKNPRWGLDLGAPDVSINIPPRWGFSLVYWRLFSCELGLCEKLSEKSEMPRKQVMNSTETVQTIV